MSLGQSSSGFIDRAGKIGLQLSSYRGDESIRRENPKSLDIGVNSERLRVVAEPDDEVTRLLLRDVVRAAADGPAGWARIDAALRERLRAACCMLRATCHVRAVNLYQRANSRATLQAPRLSERGVTLGEASRSLSSGRCCISIGIRACQCSTIRKRITWAKG